MTLQQWMKNGWLRPHLDKCRAKRNTVEYEYVGAVTEAETKELVSFVAGLKGDVLDWLEKSHPELC